MNDITAIIDAIDLIYNSQCVRELDFMPTMEPPFVMFQEHCLGISMKVLKPLYKHAYQELMTLLVTAADIRNNNEKKTKAFVLMKNQDGSNVLENYENDDYTTFLRRARTVSLSVLSVKGDLNVAYNLRKMAIADDLPLINHEMNVLSAIFSKHPKSPSGWDHRRWCLKRRMELQHRTALWASEVETERELCRAMAEKYLRNYYAWMHRHWLLQFMTDHQIEDELHFTREWLISHVSDHSAVNHRMKVIELIVLKRDSVIKMFLKIDCSQIYEFQFIVHLFNDCYHLLQSRPGRESIWCYRRSLLIFLRSRMRFHNIGFDTTQYIDFDTLNISALSLNDRSCESIGDPPPTPLYASEIDLTQTLYKELHGAFFLILNPSLWDHKQQVHYALRYTLYLLDQRCVVSLQSYYCLSILCETSQLGQQGVKFIDDVKAFLVQNYLQAPPNLSARR